jgi:hypothetical protein
MIPPPMMTIFMDCTLLCLPEQRVYPTRRLGKLSRFISDNDPTLKCIECGWKGEFVNNMGPGLRIFDPEGQQTFLDKEK